MGWLPSCAFYAGDLGTPPGTLSAANFAFSLCMRMPDILLWGSTRLSSPFVFSNGEGANGPGTDGGGVRATALRQREVHVDRLWGQLGCAKGQYVLRHVRVGGHVFPSFRFTPRDRSFFLHFGPILSVERKAGGETADDSAPELVVAATTGSYGFEHVFSSEGGVVAGTPVMIGMTTDASVGTFQFPHHEW